MKKDQYIEKGLSLEQMRLNKQVKRRIRLGTVRFFTLTFVAWNIFFANKDVYSYTKTSRNPFKLDPVIRFKTTSVAIHPNESFQIPEMESIDKYALQLRAIYRSGDSLYIKKYVIPEFMNDEDVLDAIKRNDVAFVNQSFDYTIEEVPMTEPFEHLEENTWYLDGMMRARIKTTEIETPEENLEDITLFLWVDIAGVVICGRATIYYYFYKSETEYKKKKKSIKQLKF